MSVFSRHPADRMSSSATTALAVLAATAMTIPSSGPNRRPDASVKAVRGNGNTVATVWVARKASGNQGPSEVAQSRNCTAVGNGTNNATATSPRAAAAVIAMRVGLA